MTSRSGLGDEPLFLVRLGGLYVVRLHIAMGNAAGRLPLIVDGVSSITISAAGNHGGTPLQVRIWIVCQVVLCTKATEAHI